MLWNFFGLQRKLDALFDGGWICLGVDTVNGAQWHFGEWLDEATTPLHRASDSPTTA